jgi:RNase adaptor protein for sRNA GlmZ degradation
MEDYRNHSDEYGDLACTLFRLQPWAALDGFLSKPNRKRHLGFRARFIKRHGSVVQCAPEDVLLQWVSAEPETRSAVLASEIDLFERKRTNESASSLDESASAVTLSPLAASLLELAPDRTSVLEGFSRHLHPIHWSGSLAQTLAPYLSLLESLVGHADSVVAAWAHDALKVMRQRIENDRTMDIIREQSFE